MVGSIGLAIPGGTVRHAVNLGSTAHRSPRLGPAGGSESVENDVRTAALGHTHHPNGRISDIVYVGLGTGIRPAW